ncbi:lecithin retinol acyltransferase-like [Anarrhichthys ocellatus]|uniref:lecithin retinol acyltransferase-like n=1 Tax=Anarrhichthys ocellatus TaxID=433405 RepID=UPI0012EE349A|nr:lecithin retinol acyltransferase-like [Anarrhichthys ocellatus]
MAILTAVPRRPVIFDLYLPLLADWWNYSNINTSSRDLSSHIPPPPPAPRSRPQLLALLFISTQRPDPRDGKRLREEEEEDEDGRSGGRKDRKLSLRRGDLLQVPRTLFTHFGIYLGGDRVAHFIPDIMPVVSSDQCRIGRMVTDSRLLLGVLAKRGSVRVDSLEDFAFGAQIFVNTLDEVCSRPALQREEVARRAEKLQGHVTYSLLWYNCEHYVMYCRYGTVMSYQTFQVPHRIRLKEENQVH